MKVFKVTVQDSGWDTYEGVVVVADSEESVRKMFHKEDFFGDKIKRLYVNGEYTNVRFEDWQGDLIIEEVDTSKEAAVLYSFIRG